MKALKVLLAATALLVPFGAAEAQTTIVQKTVETPRIPTARTLTLEAFDTNKDGQLSIEEIGEEMFHIFDTDNNGFLDNLEMKRVTVLTVRPVDVKTYTYVDVDGKTQIKDVTHEEVLQRSGLAQFDKDGTGLSPEKFVGKSFLQLDLNKDKIIDLGEWKNAYIESRKPLNARQDIYNQ